MMKLDEGEIRQVVEPLLVFVGLPTKLLEVRPYDEPPFDDMAVVKITFPRGDFSEGELQLAVSRAEACLSRALDSDIRADYWDTDLPLGEIPQGHALLQFDGFPFALRPAHS
jgi:hypothetical protein